MIEHGSVAQGRQSDPRGPEMLQNQGEIVGPKSPATSWSNRWFLQALVGIVVFAAGVRLVYILGDDRFLIGGDGFDYFFSARRLADGLGYTRIFQNSIGHPAAHHPPAWTTVLAVVSWGGARSQQAAQLTASGLGLVVVALVALVGRRYFDARSGLIAAVLAAVYPGFWLLEGNMLAEALALVMLGVLTLIVADLRDRPTVARSAAAGCVGALLILTRTEQVAFMAVVVVPILLRAHGLPLAQRLVRIGVSAAACVALLAPWGVYNTARFHEFVPLSTGDGSTLLAGNCAPGSFTGGRLGFWDNTCTFRLARQYPDYDEADLNRVLRKSALSNVRAEADRLPIVVPARVGRMLAVFRPSQTVAFVADWMKVDTWLIWAWVASFWVVLALAVMGTAIALRSRIPIWPLVAPVVVAVVVSAAYYGEPRYHTLADLGILVLAGFAIDRVVSMFTRRASTHARGRTGSVVPSPDPLPAAPTGSTP